MRHLLLFRLWIIFLPVLRNGEARLLQCRGFRPADGMHSALHLGLGSRVLRRMEDDLLIFVFTKV